jgi:hypothetical protein
MFMFTITVLITVSARQELTFRTHNGNEKYSNIFNNNKFIQFLDEFTNVTGKHIQNDKKIISFKILIM